MSILQMSPHVNGNFTVSGVATDRSNNNTGIKSDRPRPCFQPASSPLVTIPCITSTSWNWLTNSAAISFWSATVNLKVRKPNIRVFLPAELFLIKLCQFFLSSVIFLLPQKYLNISFLNT